MTDQEAKSDEPYGFVEFDLDEDWKGHGRQAFRLDSILGWREYGLNYVHEVTELKILENGEVFWYGAIGTPEEIEAAIMEARRKWRDL